MISDRRLNRDAARRSRKAGDPSLVVTKKANTAHHGRMLRGGPSNDGDSHSNFKSTKGSNYMLNTNRRASASGPDIQIAPPPSISVRKFSSMFSTSDNKKGQNGVTFAPLPPTCSRLKKVAPSPRHEEENTSFNSKGFRCDYSLGESARSSSHMVIQPTSDQAFQAANTLKKHDFAFVKRSDGTYSYAILAFRSLQPTHRGKGPTAPLEECMVFVLGGKGSTKILKRKQWGEFVRLVSASVSDDDLPTVKTEKQKQDKLGGKEDKDDWFLPSIISFVPCEFDDLSDIDKNSRWK